ncbi:Aspartate--tRNA ligase, cytoplasmic [Hypsizygus marmoreus]|uniref:aspartate--tRNA ligase n=1 Tax=Hypsizygus marmoreus TaxID=39966 RepID=A0A369JD10_HYPMA|nr:Aspartate--tRNA ligase, cytoplasmic [Hypsizygus marmoreus]
MSSKDADTKFDQLENPRGTDAIVEVGSGDLVQDTTKETYGVLPLHQSQKKTGLARLTLTEFNESYLGKTVRLRCRLSLIKDKGSVIFLTVRQGFDSVQAVCHAHEGGPSKQMLKWIAKLRPESILLIEGVATKSDIQSKSITITNAEIACEKVFLIAAPQGALPFDLTDAGRPETTENDPVQYSKVLLDTRLDNRVLDLRTRTNHAIFVLQSAIPELFSSYLRSRGFLEIHSPKLQGGASESGSSVFTLSYFKGTAFLAQSPQLAKQMCISADFERVFEIGPVFRAENAQTHRHLSEFVGLDLEMAIEEHYHEAMYLIDDTLKAIFRGLRDGYRKEIDIVYAQFPAEEFKWREGPEGTLKFTFAEAVDLLVEDGVPREDLDDFDTINEKRLGRVIKAKYDTDYYIIDKFPLRLRPFYTMPDADDPTIANAYDFFMRGEEILSGAQRVHDPVFLLQRIKENGINPASMQGYLDAFKLACPPHAGGGIGLERVLMFFLKLSDIRKTSLFPRDRKRLSP